MTYFDVKPLTRLTELFDEEKDHGHTTPDQVIRAVFHGRKLRVRLVVLDEESDRPLYSSDLFSGVVAGQKIEFDHVLGDFKFTT